MSSTGFNSDELKKTSGTDIVELVCPVFFLGSYTERTNWNTQILILEWKCLIVGRKKDEAVLVADMELDKQCLSRVYKTERDTLDAVGPKLLQ